MHLLKHTKTPKDRPAVPIRTIWEIPSFRRERGKRYDKNGKFVCNTGLKHRPDPRVAKAIKDAVAAARKLPMPVEVVDFDLSTFTPLAGRILLKRPPAVKTEGGVQLPEGKERSESWFYVVKTGPGVTLCAPGDRVVMNRNHRPKPVRLGKPFHIGRESGVAAIVDGPLISVAEIIQ